VREEYVGSAEEMLEMMARGFVFFLKKVDDEV